MIKDTFISNDMNKVHFSYNWQFLLFIITQSVLFFLCRQKEAKSSAHGRFLNGIRS